MFIDTIPDFNYLQDINSFLDTYFLKEKESVKKEIGKLINELSKKQILTQVEKKDYSTIKNQFRKYLNSRNIVKDFIEYYNKKKDTFLDLGNVLQNILCLINFVLQVFSSFMSSGRTTMCVPL